VRRGFCLNLALYQIRSRGDLSSAPDPSKSCHSLWESTSVPVRRCVFTRLVPPYTLLHNRMRLPVPHPPLLNLRSPTHSPPATAALFVDADTRTDILATMARPSHPPRAARRAPPRRPVRRARRHHPNLPCHARTHYSIPFIPAWPRPQRGPHPTRKPPCRPPRSAAACAVGSATAHRARAPPWTLRSPPARSRNAAQDRLLHAILRAAPSPSVSSRPSPRRST